MPLQHLVELTRFNRETGWLATYRPRIQAVVMVHVLRQMGHRANAEACEMRTSAPDEPYATPTSFEAVSVGISDDEVAVVQVDGTRNRTAIQAALKEHVTRVLSFHRIQSGPSWVGRMIGPLERDTKAELYQTQIEQGLAQLRALDLANATPSAVSGEMDPVRPARRF